jgi:nucleoside-diphosphate-sugar epimerase
LNVLVLGGSGFIGPRIADALRSSGWANATCAARQPARAPSVTGTIRVDPRDPVGLAKALQGMDAVVNCLVPDEASVADGARCLAAAAASGRCRRVVHLSTMSVYGAVEGVVTEEAALDPSAGWYARDMCAAEGHLAAYSRQGGEVVMLRKGCIVGPGSEPWVGRIGRLLCARRIGDLGLGGDGWSNLVHVDDVSQAVLSALRMPVRAGAPTAFNLAAPDSPRWNEYFTDFALAIRATPLRRLRRRRLKIDAYVAGPLLKIAERLSRRGGRPGRRLPDPLPPGLLRLWAQEIRLDVTAATREMRLRWTTYGDSLRSSVDWFRGADR